MRIDLPIPQTMTNLEQARSYLMQLTEQLQWALETIDGNGGGEAVVYGAPTPGAQEQQSQQDALDTFNSIKALIIKSADIVKARYEQIDNLLTLSGKYVAQADFGPGGVAQYIEDTQMSISATSEYVNQNFYKKEVIDNIDDRVQGLEDQVKSQEGYIRYGNVGSWLDQDALGIEIGEIDTITGITEKRYARFTSYGLELFGDSMDTPVAYVYQRKLYITDAEVTGKLTLGGYEIDTARGLAFKWVGR